MKDINKHFGEFMNRNIVFSKGDKLSINNGEEIKEILIEHDLCIDMKKLDKYLHKKFKLLKTREEKEKEYFNIFTKKDFSNNDNWTIWVNSITKKEKENIKNTMSFRMYVINEEIRNIFEPVVDFLSNLLSKLHK